VEKARLDKVLQNVEIRTMITAIGTGIGTMEGEGAFDLSKLRLSGVRPGLPSKVEARYRPADTLAGVCRIQLLASSCFAVTLVRFGRLSELSR
jgi:hypothetical protein